MTNSFGNKGFSIFSKFYIATILLLANLAGAKSNNKLNFDQESQKATYIAEAFQKRKSNPEMIQNVLKGVKNKNDIAEFRRFLEEARATSKFISLESGLTQINVLAPGGERLLVAEAHPTEANTIVLNGVFTIQVDPNNIFESIFKSKQNKKGASIFELFVNTVSAETGIGIKNANAVIAYLASALSADLPSALSTDRDSVLSAKGQKSIDVYNPSVFTSFKCGDLGSATAQIKNGSVELDLNFNQSSMEVKSKEKSLRLIYDKNDFNSETIGCLTQDYVRPYIKSNYKTLSAENRRKIDGLNQSLEMAYEDQEENIKAVSKRNTSKEKSLQLEKQGRELAKQIEEIKEDVAKFEAAHYRGCKDIISGKDVALNQCIESSKQCLLTLDECHKNQCKTKNIRIDMLSLGENIDLSSLIPQLYKKNEQSMLNAINKKDGANTSFVDLLTQLGEIEAGLKNTKLSGKELNELEDRKIQVEKQIAQPLQSEGRESVNKQKAIRLNAFKSRALLMTLHDGLTLSKCCGDNECKKLVDRKFKVNIEEEERPTRPVKTKEEGAL